ncbi:MAG TPA: thiamine pyrophosphate-dependent enzyme [Candidatus Omnitrophota bacterium]|nr:thiamine pyrophosphate-dependent enzyme [Candidatus Omnitrophota bacterium]HSA30833.1 thiamine pyrophosphate-dependent enzyme [Candidatus Omnitrophota bacterium]
MNKPLTQQKVLLSGNEAVAWGARAAGVCFASAYPGTPSTEILETMGAFPELEAQWAVNEKVAYEAAFGACIAGRRALTACKHVGLNVAMDPLMTTAYSGVNAGFVAVVADDPGMHSSQNEQDTRRVAPYAKVPLLEPSSPSEAYAFIGEAFKISEQFDVPVLFRVTTRISHTKESFDAVLKRENLKKSVQKDPKKYVMIPGHARPRHVDLERRLMALQDLSEKTPLNRIELNDRKVGFIVSGVAALYAKEAFPNASFLTLGMPFPFPVKLMKTFAGKVEKLYVIEELEPFIEEKLKQEGIRAVGKKPSWRCGELSPQAVKAIVKGKEREAAAAKARRPLLCPGCPHRPAFRTLKKAGVYVTGDIGCYTLGALEPLAALHTQICMGASIPFFEGMGKMQDGEKAVAVIGDSTFIHTGINGLISAAYNGAKGVIVIMDNAITAMTGGQQNPGTGVTLQGKETRRVSIEKLCGAAGADQVDVLNPYEMDGFQALLKTRLAEDKLSVIIVRAPCKMVDRSRSAVFEIDAQKCKKCRQCLMLDCPAILEGVDGMITINEALCVGCGLCKQVCKFDAISLKKKQDRS